MAYIQKSLLNRNRVVERNENEIVRDIAHLIGFTEELESQIAENDNVVIVDDYSNLPLVGEDDALYAVRNSTATYIWDATISDYVLLNNPEVVNPDAPEEGTTYYARLATSATLRDCIYDNGTAGVGATLTGTINSGLSQSNQVDKIDNTYPLLGDVILVKNQASAIQNGLYEVTQLGSGAEPFILTRIDGYDETAEVYPSITFISAGSANINRYFTQTTVNPVIGTNNLNYAISSIGAAPILPTTFVDTATSAPLPTCVYANGTTYATLPAFGATLTATVVGALGTINGVTMTSDRLIVVKDQVNQAHNGTYKVTDTGSTTRRWQLTRVDYSTSFFYRSKEFVVSNINSTLFGDRYTVSSPLSMLNSAWGTTNILFTKNVSSTNLYNTNGTLTSNRTVTGGGFSLTFNTSPIALGFYVNGNSTRNFYVNQFGSGDAIFAQATTGYVADFLGGNGTAVRIQSDLVGLNCSGNAIGGFFKPLAVGGTGLQAVQDIGAFAASFTGTTKVISPSASLIDTAFAVRNNVDNADLVAIRGNGNADFYGNIYARSELIYGVNFRSLYFLTSGIGINSGIEYNSRGEIAVAYVSHNFKTENVITTPGSFLMKVSNGTNLKMSIDKDGSFKTVSPSASSLDTAFAVRNNTDTNNHFQVLGNGSVYSQGKNFGVRDTVYGYNAGANMGAGAYYNTFFGFQAGLNVTGAACVAIGESCMRDDSTFSTAVGSTAMLGGAGYSVAVGVRASRLANNDFSVTIGADAGYYLSNSQKNIIIGWSAASAMTGGNNNVIIGNYNNPNPSTLVTSNKNTLIGDAQWDFPAVMKGSVVLGYEAKATGDNQFSVGSVAENAGTVTAEVNASANVWNVIINGVARKILLA